MGSDLEMTIASPTEPHQKSFLTIVLSILLFQKKSNHGIATPQQDIELIETRLKRAKEHYDRYYKQHSEETSNEPRN